MPDSSRLKLLQVADNTPFFIFFPIKMGKYDKRFPHGNDLKQWPVLSK